MDYRVTRDQLPNRAFGAGVSADLFNGSDHGLGTISLMFGEVQPGASVALHRHTYEEVFVVTEGRGAFTIGETTVHAGPGDIVMVPAGVPHRFVNTGDGPLRQTAVHSAPAIAIEWLEKPGER